VVDGEKSEVDSRDEGKHTGTWASAHRGKWGQLTPCGKMDEKLKSEIFIF